MRHIEGRTYSSGASSIGGTLDGNTTVGPLERGRVVNTVTSHSRKMAALLEHLDDLVLVLGRDFREPVGALDEVVQLRCMP